MRNTLCEKLTWLVLSPISFKFIEEHFQGVDIKTIKKKTKINYKVMIKRTPDIGRFKKNSLRVCLTSGIFWFSLYDAMEGKMDKSEFGEMVVVSIKIPLLRNSFKKEKPFSFKAQQKKFKKNKTANEASASEFNWNAEFIFGRDENEYTIIYHRCGLCALGKQEHHEELVPYICKLDYPCIDFMGGVLKRTKTLAEGNDCCDFYICKKGSKWDF